MLKMTQQTYVVDQHKQLIELNKDLVNFDLNFKIVSTSGAPFQAIVVDQKQLDENNNLQYKDSTDGQLSGNIVADRNIYRSYVLVLKAPQPTEINVTINIKPIQPNPQYMQQRPPQQGSPQQGPPQQGPPQGYPNGPPQGPPQGYPNGQKYSPGNYKVPPQQHAPHPPPPIPPAKENNWSKILITAIVIVGSGALVYWYINQQKSSNSEESKTISETPTPTESVIPSAKPEELLVSSSPEPIPDPSPVPAGLSLKERLEKLNV